MAVGDEGLRAVDDPVGAVAARGRPDRGQVGAGAGLGHRDGGDQLAGAEAGQPLGLPLVGGQVHQVRGDHVEVDAEAGRDGHAHLGQFLAGDRVEPVVARRAAAVLRGHLQAEEALLAGRAPGGPVDAPFGGETFLVGEQFARGERGHRGSEQVMVLVEQQSVHRQEAFFRVGHEGGGSGRPRPES